MSDVDGLPVAWRVNSPMHVRGFYEDHESAVALSLDGDTITPLYAAQCRAKGVEGVPYEYRAIAHLIGSIFFAGDFKAETANERTLESLLKEVGTRYASWEQIEDGEENLNTLTQPATDQALAQQAAPND